MKTTIGLLLLTMVSAGCGKTSGFALPAAAGHQYAGTWTLTITHNPGACGTDGVVSVTVDRLGAFNAAGAPGAIDSNGSIEFIGSCGGQSAGGAGTCASTVSCSGNLVGNDSGTWTMTR